MGKIKNEVGNTYGYLTVIQRMPNNSENRAMWLCKCKCGNETVVMGKHLRSGNTKSCGCLNKEINSKRCLDIHKDMIGKTYGYLTVIDYGDYAIKPDGRKDRKMLCKCELCESLIQVRASDLKNGKQIVIDKTYDKMGVLKEKLIYLKDELGIWIKHKVKNYNYIL